MKQLVPIILLFLSYTLRAQDGPEFPDMRSWGLSYTDSSDRYIFADTAFIRVSPDTRQTPQDTLVAGDNIKVLEVTGESLTIRGLKGPWLRISYVRNNVTKSGYVWQGLVSCAPIRRGDTKFVYGIERRADSSFVSGMGKETIRRYLVRVKVVKNGSILAKAGFITFDDESANFSDGKIMSGMGLTNVQHVVVFSFTGGACAVPTYDYYFAWTKDSLLVRLPDKMNVSDAGNFYHSEKFTFPNEKNGRADLIRWEMTEEEGGEEEEKDGSPILKLTAKKSVVYQWDGANKTTRVVTP
jgi:hypothetical protein